jgi:hypothetical protein
MMNERRPTHRSAGNAAPKEAPSASVPALRLADPDPRESFDRFQSESDLESRGALMNPARSRMSRRLPHGADAFLSDADAFLSEVSACASDRPTKRLVVESFPTEDGTFATEDESPFGEESAPAIDAANQTQVLPVGEVMPPIHGTSHYVLAMTMRVSALSAAFFIAVILLTEVLDWTHRAVFTGGASVAYLQEPVAPRTVAEPVAAPAPPIDESTMPEPLPSSEAASAAPLDPPAPTLSPAAVLAAAPSPSSVQREDRQAELTLAELTARAVTVESAALPLAPVHVAAVDAPPAPAVARAMPEPIVARAMPSASFPPALLAVSTETDQIDGVLTRYRGAFNTLDSAAARGVWPTVDERALGRAFARLEQQEVAFEHCDIDVEGVRAAATCTGSARYVPKVGSRNQQSSAREWRFNLQKVDDRWVIEAVDAR